MRWSECCWLEGGKGGRRGAYACVYIFFPLETTDGLFRCPRKKGRCERERRLALEDVDMEGRGSRERELCG